VALEEFHLLNNTCTALSLREYK